MNHDVELLAVGAGPSNLALAVALEELAPELAENSMLIERAEKIVWQQGLLLPWATSQISFLKDLVTLRNPCSDISFVNFLHSVGRLDHFINLGHVWPFRSEISEYLAWVAASLRKVRIELGTDAAALQPQRDAAGTLTGWTCRQADGSTISSRYLVIATGRDAYVPPALAGVSARRVVHSTRYTHRLPALRRDMPRRVTVLGGAQSAAEIFRAAQDDFPDAEVTWLMRSLGPSALQSSRFSNEMYYPSVVDKVFGSSPEGREQIRKEMHRTNYSGVESDLLQSIYADRYVKQLSGQDRTKLITMAELVGASETDDGLLLEVQDRATGETVQHETDVVFLGTGFARGMPRLVRQLAGELGLSSVRVSRPYRLLLDEPSDAACYLHGMNEDTHGVGDSLFSVMADRTAATVHDILAQRSSNRMPLLDRPLAA